MAGGEGRWGVLFNGSINLFNGSGLFCEMKEVLRMEGEEGCTTMSMYSIPLNCTLKTGYGGKFYIMRVLPQFKKFNNKSSPPLFSDHRSSSDSSSRKPGGRLRDGPNADQGILASKKLAWDTNVLE